MILYSTNHKSPEVSFKEAIFKGLPDDNGLFMPTQIPILPKDFFKELPDMELSEIAFEVSRAMIGDEIATSDLKAIVEDAVNFPAPLVTLKDNIFALELFQGPTLAFKDFGARFMSRVMGHFLKKEQREINILVATSGDTGSAVAQGFFNIPGIKVTILYPKGKVSFVQEQQLTTNGGNITALEIDGVFDDCQRMVKEAFLDPDLNQRMSLSSANSINIARLLPQSFYYFYAWGQAQKQGKSAVVFCTPSGNFGNICGGLMAFRMGLPIKKFIAATNANAVVPEYLKTGKFEPRPSVKTYANAMDVGNPSNFPRLQALFDGKYEDIVTWVNGASLSDDQIISIIREVDEEQDYLLCPHSAIGYEALKEYLAGEPTGTKGIFLATAHPAKFGDIVKKATGTDVQLPDRLKSLINREKKATKMEANFTQFKEWLIHSSH